MRSTTTQDNPIARDIQNVVSDAQDLLKTVKTEGVDRASDKMSEVRAKVQTQLDSARKTLGELQQTVQATATQYMDTTDQYVRTNPWQAVGISAAVGALMGFLIARR